MKRRNFLRLSLLGIAGLFIKPPKFMPQPIIVPTPPYPAWGDGIVELRTNDRWIIENCYIHNNWGEGVIMVYDA